MVVEKHKGLEKACGIREREFFFLISKYWQSQTLVNIKSVDVEVLALMVKVSPFLYTSLFLETFSAGRTLGFIPLSFQASPYSIS